MLLQEISILSTEQCRRILYSVKNVSMYKSGRCNVLLACALLSKCVRNTSMVIQHFLLKI